MDIHFFKLLLSIYMVLFAVICYKSNHLYKDLKIDKLTRNNLLFLTFCCPLIGLFFYYIRVRNINHNN